MSIQDVSSLSFAKLISAIRNPVEKDLKNDHYNDFAYKRT